MIRLAHGRQYDGVLVEPGDVRKDQSSTELPLVGVSTICFIAFLHREVILEVSANRCSAVGMARLEGGLALCVQGGLSAYSRWEPLEHGRQQLSITRR